MWSAIAKLPVRVVAAGFTGIVGLAAGGLLLQPALADDSRQSALTQSTWYWEVQASGQALPDPTVPANDLAVGGPNQNGQPPSETYLEFDTSSIPSGSTVSSFVVTLPVDPKATNVVPNGAQPAIVACAP